MRPRCRLKLSSAGLTASAGCILHRSRTMCYVALLGPIDSS